MEKFEVNGIFFLGGRMVIGNGMLKEEQNINCKRKGKKERKKCVDLMWHLERREKLIADVLVYI